MTELQTLCEFPYPETVVVIGTSYCVHCHEQMPGKRSHTCNPTKWSATWRASWRSE